jgi:hypothetical protein
MLPNPIATISHFEASPKPTSPIPSHFGSLSASPAAFLYGWFQGSS